MNSPLVSATSDLNHTKTSWVDYAISCLIDIIRLRVLKP